MYPYYDWFRSQIKKRSYIWDAYKGRGVRDHFVVLHNLTQQLLFYDVISIDIAYTMHEISDHGKCDYVWMFPHWIKKVFTFLLFIFNPNIYDFICYSPNIVPSLPIIFCSCGQIMQPKDNQLRKTKDNQEELAVRVFCACPTLVQISATPIEEYTLHTLFYALGATVFLKAH